MITTWEQRERRDGIVLKQVSFEVPPPSTAVPRRRSSRPRSRRARRSSRSRTSPTSPARSCRSARSSSWRGRAGIEVFVDGAHAFAHFPFTRDELGVRLLRHQPAQVAARADRHRLPLRAQGQEEEALAADGGAAGAGRRTSGSTRRSAPTRRPTTTPSRRRSPSTAASAPSARSRGCASCGTAGPSGCWPRATG